MAPIRVARRQSPDLDADNSNGPADPVYRERRARNNMAVKKSRNKAKTKATLIEEKVSDLKAANDNLERNIEKVTDEIVFLKKMFVEQASASSYGVKLDDSLLEALLNKSDNMPEDDVANLLVDAVVKKSSEPLS